MSAVKPTAREINEKGIHTSNDLVKFQLALVRDLLEGRISASEAKRTSANVGKRLKELEVRLRYGSKVR